MLWIVTTSTPCRVIATYCMRRLALVILRFDHLLVLHALVNIGCRGWRSVSASLFTEGVLALIKLIGHHTVVDETSRVAHL